MPNEKPKPTLNFCKYLKERYNKDNNPKKPFSANGGENIQNNVKKYLDRKARQLSGQLPETDPCQTNQSETDIVLREQKILKRLIHRLTLLKFPEKAYLHQLQAREDLGYGRETAEGQVGRDQFFQKNKEMQSTELTSWFNYMLSADAIYPPEFKYIVLRDIASSTVSGGKRTKDTIDTYPVFDAGAISEVYQDWALQAQNNNGKLTLNNFTQAYLDKLGVGAKAYDQMLKEIDTVGAEKTAGEWRMYPQNSNPGELALAVGKTPWCTRATSNAQTQLAEGNFYVYFSNDINGNSNLPRVAIKMINNNQTIAEIRGIADNMQNLEGQFADIVSTKLKEENLPNYQEYVQKAEDLKRLTEVYNKNQLGEQLNTEELSFLYEVKSKIKSFGYIADPRIKQIIDTRDLKQDLAMIYDCRPEQIATNKSQIDDSTIIYYGDLDLSDIKESTDASKILRNIQFVSGDLKTLHSISRERSVLNSGVRGFLPLLRLTSAEGLVLPPSV